MKKRLYRWRFFLAVVVVILAGAGIWIFQKKSRTFVPATEVSLKGPYGTLTLQLPEEWNYEIQTEEQDTVYGISFYRGEDKENEVTEENEQETKDEIIRDTEDKSIKATKEKTTSKATKETRGTVETKVETAATTVPAQELEPPKTVPVEDSKVETKKIDLSKYDYYEESINGSYKGFIKDTAEMSKLKSLIDNAICEFGYTNVKVVQDSSIAQSGLRSFTANKTNVENAVYNSNGFTICYYAVKEYHISSDGTKSLFQSRSYIKVK